MKKIRKRKQDRTSSVGFFHFTNRYYFLDIKDLQNTNRWPKPWLNQIPVHWNSGTFTWKKALSHTHSGWAPQMLSTTKELLSTCLNIDSHMCSHAQYHDEKMDSLVPIRRKKAHESDQQVTCILEGTLHRRICAASEAGCTYWTRTIKTELCHLVTLLKQGI